MDADVSSPLRQWCVAPGPSVRDLNDSSLWHFCTSNCGLTVVSKNLLILPSKAAKQFSLWFPSLPQPVTPQDKLLGGGMCADSPVAAELRLLWFCREVEAGGLCNSLLQGMSSALPFGHWSMMYLLEAAHSLRGTLPYSIHVIILVKQNFGRGIILYCTHWTLFQPVCYS